MYMICRRHLCKSLEGHYDALQLGDIKQEVHMDLGTLLDDGSNTCKFAQMFLDTKYTE